MTLLEGAIGKELIIDLYDCDTTTFTKESLDKFFVDLCNFIDMERTELFYWEYFEDSTKTKEELEHLAGISAVQFIKTSNITVHTFDNLKKCSINVFSCKDFDENLTSKFCFRYFKGHLRNFHCIPRF
jgi:S-adenosylmethionine/arginine decarboxylase-like enzyme